MSCSSRSVTEGPRHPGHRTKPAGAVVEGAIYTIEEFKARVGWSEQAFRTARHSGLKVHRRGRNGFVYGGDFLEWVRGDASTPEGGEG